MFLEFSVWVKPFPFWRLTFLTKWWQWRWKLFLLSSVSLPTPFSSFWRALRSEESIADILQFEEIKPGQRAGHPAQGPSNASSLPSEPLWTLLEVSWHFLCLQLGLGPTLTVGGGPWRVFPRWGGCPALCYWMISSRQGHSLFHRLGIWSPLSPERCCPGLWQCLCLCSMVFCNLFVYLALFLQLLVGN